jgi:fluoride ion exporter CrcB/FEX
VKGIDYVKLVSSSRWPFASFVQTLAELMGRKGGLTAFSTFELEALKHIHSKHPSLTAMLLKNAFESSTINTVGQLALALQTLTHSFKPNT